MSEEIKARIQHGDMTTFQKVAIVICLLINMMDGFDVLAVAFAAPGIAAEWNLSPTDLGILFSSGFLGMMLGSLFLAPIADQIGRRKTIIICLVILSIGMFASAFAQTITFISAMRFITGIGIGAMLASLNTIVAEYSSDKRRPVAVTFMQSGYTIGAVLGGAFTSAILLTFFDWRAIFIFGGSASLIILPFVYFFLPESISFLLDRQPRGALGQINRILSRLKLEHLASLPPKVEPHEQAQPNPLTLFKGDYAVQSMLLISAFFLASASIYFVLSWMPKVIVDIGLDATNGVTSGVLMNLGGIFGVILIGLAVSNAGIGTVMILFGTMAAATVTFLGLASADLVTIYSLALVSGVFMFGTMAGFYVCLPNVYPPAIRATGSGWVIGLGRLGAVVGPFVAGLLIEYGLSREVYFFLMSIPFCIAGFLILKLSGFQQKLLLSQTAT